MRVNELLHFVRHQTLVVCCRCRCCRATTVAMPFGMHFRHRQTDRVEPGRACVWYFWIPPFTSQLHLSISIFFIHIFPCVIPKKEKEKTYLDCHEKESTKNAPKLKWWLSGVLLVCWVSGSSRLLQFLLHLLLFTVYFCNEFSFLLQTATEKYYDRTNTFYM